MINEKEIKKTNNELKGKFIMNLASVVIINIVTFLMLNIFMAEPIWYAVIGILFIFLPIAFYVSAHWNEIEDVEKTVTGEIFMFKRKKRWYEL